MYFISFGASTTSRLDNKVNKFLSDNNVDILELQFSSSYGRIYAAILYN